MKQWSDETATIIANHKYDFDNTTYSDKMAHYGGYSAYLQTLGGIFARGCPKITSVQTLRQACEYVCGLMAIWGFDYNNGTTYWKWGNGTDDGFYRNTKGKCNAGTISALCQGADGKSRTTNCNYGVDTLLRAGGIFKMNCDRYKGMVNQKVATVVRNKSKLRPGDLVHFFSSKVTSDNPSVWKGWKHVAIVVENDGDPVLCDFGSRFIKTKKPFHMWSEYTYAGWAGEHLYNLEDDKVKSEFDLAVELKRAIDAYLEAKKKEYGSTIFDIAKLYADDRPQYLRAAADYVLNGYAGSGEARKVFFGSDYDDVQAKVNWIIQTALEVIDGKYGTGEARKEALGNDYYVVQNQVNRILA